MVTLVASTVPAGFVTYVDSRMELQITIDRMKPWPVQNHAGQSEPTVTMNTQARSNHLIIDSIKTLLPISLFVFLSLAQMARAQVTYDFVYDPDTHDTTLTIGGSWTNGTFVNEEFPATWEQAWFGIIDDAMEFSAYGRPGTGGSYSTYSTPTVSIPSEIAWASTNTLDTAGSYTGDLAGFYIPDSGSMTVFAPLDYVSGSTLNATAVFQNTTLANFGLSDGDGGTISLFGGNSVIWTASVGAPGSAVPEPSTYAAIIGGLALGFVAWRRHRAGVSAAA